MRLARFCFRWTLAALPVLFVAGRVARGEGLDRSLLDQAPGMLETLRSNGCRNVGVLKFLVRSGSGPAVANAGPLNLGLARRLEVALVLANRFDRPLGILHDASAVGSRTPGASHLTAPGRRALFAARYPLAWGRDEVEADALISGVVAVGSGRTPLDVTVVAYLREADRVVELARFVADPDLPVLAEAGRGYVLTRAIAAPGSPTPQPNPIQDPAAPVALDILYDGIKVPLEVREGRAAVREPHEGQRVSLVLRKQDRTPGRYAVALSVNGVNTIDKERVGPLHARKWVLDPSTPEITVRGFQVESQTAEAFRILSGTESANQALDYGVDAGLIDLVVFQERKSPATPTPPSNEAEDLVALSRGILPATPPTNLAALKFQLRHPRSDVGRGLIHHGGAIASATTRVEFLADPTPVMAVSIRYVHP